MNINVTVNGNEITDAGKKVVWHILGIVSKIFLVVSIIFVVVAAIVFVVDLNAQNNSEECVGTIVGFDIDVSGADGDISKFPIVSYSVNGQDYKFVSNYYSSSMEAGDDVEVLYDRDNWSDATIKSGLFFIPIVFGIIAIVFGIVAIVMIVVRRKMRKRIQQEKQNNFYGL